MKRCKLVKEGSFKNFKKLEIGLPPIDIQEKFAEIAKQTELLKIKYQESEKELNNLFGSLMQKSF